MDNVKSYERKRFFLLGLGFALGLLLADFTTPALMLGFLFWGMLLARSRNPNNKD